MSNRQQLENLFGFSNIEPPIPPIESLRIETGKVPPENDDNSIWWIIGAIVMLSIGVSIYLKRQKDEED